MTEKIYRVQGCYRSGYQVSHLVGAPDAVRAMMSVQAVDPRIIRITSATIAADV